MTGLCGKAHAASSRSRRTFASFWPRTRLAQPPRTQKVAFHPPCTLQHGLKIRGQVEALLKRLGPSSYLCATPTCAAGRRGPIRSCRRELSQDLRTRKLAALQEGAPEVILSANIGCIAHLQGGTGTPVRHWIEWVDERCRK